MEKLLAYINSLPPGERHAFAESCGTTLGYLRNACSFNKKIGIDTCLIIAKESDYTVLPDDIRPDKDWQILRLAMNKYLAAAQAQQPQPATAAVAQGVA